MSLYKEQYSVKYQVNSEDFIFDKKGFFVKGKDGNDFIVYDKILYISDINISKLVEKKNVIIECSFSIELIGDLVVKFVIDQPIVVNEQLLINDVLQQPQFQQTLNYTKDIRDLLLSNINGSSYKVI